MDTSVSLFQQRNVFWSASRVSFNKGFTESVQKGGGGGGSHVASTEFRNCVEVEMAILGSPS